jgi:hypothetical protein
VDWTDFTLWAVPAAALWLTAGATVYRRRGDRLTIALMAAGIALLAAFIVGFWITLGSPPMRTLC